MITLIFKNLWRMIWVLFLQIAIFPQISFLSFVNPSFYVFFLLMLPAEWPHAVQIVIGFLVGYFIDSFTDSGGLYASAAVFITFLAPIWLKALNRRQEGDELGLFSPSELKPLQFIIYAVPMVFAHQIFMYSVEYLSFSKFFAILKNAGMNGLVTAFLVIVFRFISPFTNRNKTT